MKLPSIVSSRFVTIGGSLFLSLAGSLSAQTPSAPGAERAAVPHASVAATPAISYSAVHLDGPFVAMTFDDGPSEKLTPALLDLLAQHQIRATFFVIGENVVEHPEILQRAVREGHEIANHSWSHPSFGKMRDESVRTELQKTDDAIRVRWVGLDIGRTALGIAGPDEFVRWIGGSQDCRTTKDTKDTEDTKDRTRLEQTGP